MSKKVKVVKARERKVAQLRATEASARVKVATAILATGIDLAVLVGKPNAKEPEAARDEDEARASSREETIKTAVVAEKALVRSFVKQ